MDEDHNCPIHRRPCVNRKEENYFFRLSRYQQQIEVGRTLCARRLAVCVAARPNECSQSSPLLAATADARLSGKFSVQVFVVKRHIILKLRHPEGRLCV